MNIVEPGLLPVPIGRFAGSLFHEIQLEFQEIGRWRYAHRYPFGYLRERCREQAYYSRRPWTVAVAYSPRKPNGTRDTGQERGERREEDDGADPNPGSGDPNSENG